MKSMSTHLLARCGIACATFGLLGYAAPAMQAEDSLGYLDLRLGFNTIPTKEFSGGPVGANGQFEGEFDTAYRISIKAIGPLCSVLPIGCATYLPSRDPATPAVDTYGTYDDVLVERDWQMMNATSTFDPLVGLAINYDMYNHDGSRDPARLMPEVEMQSVSLSLFLGYGLSMRPSSLGVLHGELTAFGSAGYSSLSWTQYTQSGAFIVGQTDDTSSVYLEGGLNLGLFYTFAAGPQVGVNGSVLIGRHFNEVFREDAKFEIEGGSVGASLGWRF